MTTTYIPTTLEHTSICAALDGLCFDSEVFSEEMIESLLSTPYVFGYIALKGEQPIGYSLFSTAGNQGDLLTIGLIPEMRGSGEGKKFLRQTLLLAKDKGVEDIFLEVRPSNTAAIALYKAFGGTNVGVRKNYYINETTGEKEDATVMSLDLLAIH